MRNFLFHPVKFIKKHIQHVFFGKHLAFLPPKSLVFFPLPAAGCLHCGIAGLVAYKGMERSPFHGEQISEIRELFSEISKKSIRNMDAEEMKAAFLGGERLLEKLFAQINDLRRENAIAHLLENKTLNDSLAELLPEMERFFEEEKKEFKGKEVFLKAGLLPSLFERLEKFQDIFWHLSVDILGNADKVKTLMEENPQRDFFPGIRFFQRINTVITSIEFLEVRGRDSAGISLFLTMKKDDFEAFREKLEKKGLLEKFSQRMTEKVLGNESIRLQQTPVGENISLFFVYKVAEEIGSLGDNGAFLRNAVRSDLILQEISLSPLSFFSVAAHTRWASVGKITVANCHPVDNTSENPDLQQPYTLMAALNGDIDNFDDFRKNQENFSDLVPEEITTDTRVIPLAVEKYLKEGCDITEAFRKSVSSFTGSHAIWMQTDLAPGKLFLAQRGSGQAIFVGMGHDHYLVASEAYGFVASTPTYVKMEGEKRVQGKDGETQGQIFILTEGTGNPMTGIEGMYYDGTPFSVQEKNLKHTAVTTRDIDRQNYPHYFIKEVSEAPKSMLRTLQGRYILENSDSYYSVSLEPGALSENLKADFGAGKIRKIFIIGQGTASVAAQVAADLFRYYLADPEIQIHSMKSSELSGFHIPEDSPTSSMADALVIAISQSGTTTDTNHCVDMVKARGARTLAIVNRRDSDLTFKTEGTLYTSSGRDIEMSVASTKAFYAQIVAAALLGLELAKIRKRRNASFISNEIRELKSLPQKMYTILDRKEEIEKGARKLAPMRNYWACVGSGPNKNAADEIRIKLSELCYRTISSDYVEDKKHIDLSAEPLIFVCAAGTREKVLNDIIKDTRIFDSHKALPVVAVTEGDNRFDEIAKQIIPIPDIPEHLAPILVTLAGHIWGYYAALAIHETSIFLAKKRHEILRVIETLAPEKKDIHELLLESRFREKIAEFSLDFSKALGDGRLNSLMGAKETAELLLASLYLCARLPIAESAVDFVDENKEGAGQNILDRFMEKLEKTASFFSRPIDAIKHQAKTVTVGTSRIADKEEGVLFDALLGHDIEADQLSSRNILVLRNLQAVVSKVNGAVLYKVHGLNLLGEVTENAWLSIEKKTGSLSEEPSRVETDPALKGSKRIIVQEGNIFIGLGKKDQRQILVIPAFPKKETDTGTIEYLLSLNIDLKEEIPLTDRIRALGRRLDRIRNNVNEYSFEWKDEYLDFCTTRELFGLSAEKIVEKIVEQLKNNESSL
ncbi:SIS domain-containing protein [Desulfococcaceae bacterium OttesenSCG-928-F15]|nr:SIS domain-containing protein [Desulfococcaceae bacterium OttesenSCG-928-F15]